MSRSTVLLVAPPVLYAATWWSARVASKPHLHSLAGFVRDLADVRILELDLQTGTPTGDVNARLEKRQTELVAQVKADKSANGGKLTPAERTQVQQELDHISKRIYAAKHNGTGQ